MSGSVIEMGLRKKKNPSTIILKRTVFHKHHKKNEGNILSRQSYRLNRYTVQALELIWIQARQIELG